MRGDLGISLAEIAFPEVECDLVERALLPLFGLRQPEISAFGIQESTLAAHKFLVANFDELVHDPHPCVRSQFAHQI